MLHTEFLRLWFHIVRGNALSWFAIGNVGVFVCTRTQPNLTKFVDDLFFSNSTTKLRTGTLSYNCIFSRIFKTEIDFGAHEEKRGKITLTDREVLFFRLVCNTRAQVNSRLFMV